MSIVWVIGLQNSSCVLSKMQQYKDEERECTHCNQKLPLIRTESALVELVSRPSVADGSTVPPSSAAIRTESAVVDLLS